MIQCCICGKVFTKDGKPQHFFKASDKLIHGCHICKEGSWKSSIKELSKYLLSGYILNEGTRDEEEFFDDGYYEVIPGSQENPSFLHYKEGGEKE